MSNFHLFKRTNVLPPAITGDTERDMRALRQFCGELAQEVRQIHNTIQSFTVAVTGGAASVAVTLPAPHPDPLYSVSVVSDWKTTHAVSAKTTTGFTDSFGTAAPGGGGSLYVILVG